MRRFFQSIIVLLFLVQHVGAKTENVNSDSSWGANVVLMTEVQFSAPLSSTVLESAGSAVLNVELNNMSAIPASVDVVLISGDASRINNYATQTVTWGAGDGGPQAVTISLSNNPLCNAIEVLTFELQNPSNINLGANTQFTLTVVDNPPLVQIGSDLQGEASNNFSGGAVALSSDGNRLAIGAYANSGGGANAGHVRIYDWNGNSWAQLGTDIDGEAAGDFSGQSLALSANGNRVAIGAAGNNGGGTSAGHVRIFDWDGNSWVQFGADIDGAVAGDGSGTSVALSANGDRVFIGSPMNSNSASFAGTVRCYDWNGSAWAQVGADIDGEAAWDQSGSAVAVSANGDRIAIGAFENDGNGFSSGHVRLYDWNGAAWAQVGADIDGEGSGDESGFSIALSGDGARVAIGARLNDGNGTESGHVRLYDWDGSSWLQIGGDIDGEASGDRSGTVALSSDGSRVAIGAPRNDGNGINAGHVRLYDWNGSTWLQKGNDIDGEAAVDLANSVALAADGYVVAIGATGNDNGGTSAGHVRVFGPELCPESIKVTVKLMLEGAYDANTGLMHDSLRAKSLIPLTEPYTSLGYSYLGAATGVGVNLDPSLLNVTGQEAIIDWVIIELRDPSNNSILESAAALVKRNGEVISTEGLAELSFPLPSGSYQMAVLHRNHLGALSFQTSLSSMPVPFDFSIPGFPTIGNTDARKLINGTAVLWAGDVNFDGSIKYVGSDNDRDIVLQDIGGSIPTNTSEVYAGSDVNMDGSIKYVGNANDRDVILVNIGGSIPTVVKNTQLP